MKHSRSTVLLTIILLIVGIASSAQCQEPEQGASVFDIPVMLAQHLRLKFEIQRLGVAKEYVAAAKKCNEAIKLFPDDPSNYYALACCQTQLGKNKEALQSLELAIDKGLNNADHIEQNLFLVPLRKLDGFDELVKKAPDVMPRPSPLITRNVTPSEIVDRIATVSETNTRFQPELNAFETSFIFKEDARLGGQPASKLKSQVGMKVQQWYFSGTGAGLKNHLYDNRDGRHSNLRVGNFPQLNRVVYCEEAKQRNLDRGIQAQFFYNMITIGNASQALTRSPYWRSLPRLAYTSPQYARILNLQYQRNHLYVYPEHEDHDPGKGDVFASNTPYVLISQGSSGSDLRLLEAVAWTLASFQPKTKRKLAEGGALMAAVQMVFRRTNRRVETFEDYLTGKAHPTVFDGSTIDELRMIALAHEIKPEKVPPVVQLRVIEEDESRLGIDYFDDQPRVKLFDTPGAISRLHKSTKKDYRMVVNVQKSFDLNNRPLTYHWRVLRGDASKIKINPLNANNSQVEIIVPFQELRAIEPDSEIFSSRVDIGAFAHNGTYYSAPAFVSLYSPRNEIRIYNKQDNIESVEYVSLSGQYEDPVLTTPRVWTDRYKYDENQQLIGWTRTRGKDVQQFTADGALVVKTDDLGRALQARTVVYRRITAPKKILPSLEQRPGPHVLSYQYKSPEDKIGRIVNRVLAFGKDPIQ